MPETGKQQRKRKEVWSMMKFELIKKEGNGEIRGFKVTAGAKRKDRTFMAQLLEVLQKESVKTKEGNGDGHIHNIGVLNNRINLYINPRAPSSESEQENRRSLPITPDEAEAILNVLFKRNDLMLLVPEKHPKIPPCTLVVTVKG